MAESTVFVARHLKVAALSEGSAHGRHKARHHHGVSVRLTDKETMGDIRACEPELNGRLLRDGDAMRSEHILLRNDSNGNRAVRSKLHSQVVLSKLACLVQ